MVEELLALFIEELSANDLESQCDEELFMALSKDVVIGNAGPGTTKIKGLIQSKEVLILIDSGSSHTFISDKVATKLSGKQQLSSSCQSASNQWGLHILFLYYHISWLVSAWVQISD